MTTSSRTWSETCVKSGEWKILSLYSIVPKTDDDDSDKTVTGQIGKGWLAYNEMSSKYMFFHICIYIYTQNIIAHWDKIITSSKMDVHLQILVAARWSYCASQRVWVIWLHLVLNKKLRFGTSLIVEGGKNGFMYLNFVPPFCQNHVFQVVNRSMWFDINLDLIIFLSIIGASATSQPAINKFWDTCTLIIHLW